MEARFGSRVFSKATAGYSGWRLRETADREHLKMLIEKAECALAMMVDDGQRAGFRN